MSDSRPDVLRIAMNGVTGRMGYRQHLLRSILPIRDAGGVELPDGTRVPVEPILVGRNQAKITELAERHKVEHWSTDLDAVLADPTVDVVFDASMTSLRAATLRRAMTAGKHIFTEKPTAETLAEAIELARIARDTGVTAGVVHDKLYLPGLVKLRRLVDEGFFGRILSLRGEFGYWVFEGDQQPAQRPSWNYRAEDGGGITTDMFCHWNYVLEGIIGRVRSVTATTTTHIPHPLGRAGQRVPGHGRRRRLRDLRAADAERGPGGRPDQLLLGGPGAPRRAGRVPDRRHARLGRGRAQPVRGPAAGPHAQAGLEPGPAGDGVLPDQWLEVPANADLDNGFKAQWEEFLRDVVAGREHRFGLLSAARGVQLAELGLQSSAERRTVDIPELAL